MNNIDSKRLASRQIQEKNTKMRIQTNSRDCPRCGSVNSIFQDGPEEYFCLLCGFRFERTDYSARKLNIEGDLYPLLKSLEIEYEALSENCESGTGAKSIRHHRQRILCSK